jgi:hypothetical protein
MKFSDQEDLVKQGGEVKHEILLCKILSAILGGR